MIMKTLLLITCLLLTNLANAAGLEKLKDYLQNVTSLRASFHQEVFDKQNRKIQEVDGSMQLQKPGKFRWDYNKPYIQQIVGDGEKVWLFDPDLNQVTAQNLNKALGSSPAALLAGGKDIERLYELKDSSPKDGLEWVLATPKDKEGSFENLLLGFNGDSLVEMQLIDNFGNKTVIQFSKIERNQKIPASVFKFTPPPGADVMFE